MKFGRVSATPCSNHSSLCILLLDVFCTTNGTWQSISYSFQLLYCAGSTRYYVTRVTRNYSDQGGGEWVWGS